MDKRYQVFVSSTYADLKEERQRVIQALMELDCIPAGMELFPAADEEQFEFIKRIIDDCDYYLVIIGGRYGSLTKSGISYTEQEYDYALTRGLRITGLLHESPDDIPLGKSEKDPELRAQLKRFRDKVAEDRLVKFWKTVDQLPGLVALSLSKTIKTFPAVGWVRANRAGSEELLSEINELRKQNELLQKIVNDNKPSPRMPLANLAELDERYTVHGTFFSKETGRQRSWTVAITWGEIFALVSPYLAKYPTAEYVKGKLEHALFQKTSYEARTIDMNDQEFQTISIQLKALGLITTEYAKAVGGGMGLFWSLTPAGEQLMLQLRAVRTSK